MSDELQHAREQLRFWRAIVDNQDLPPEKRIDARTREAFWFDEIRKLLPPKPGWWWLSFADPDQPRGQQFLGVAIVWGQDMMTATQEAYRLQINPGGEVMGMVLSEPLPARDLRNRLLDRDTLAAADLAFPIGAPP